MEEAILRAIHRWSSPPLDAAFRLSHELGTAGFCTVLVVVAVVVSLLVKRPREAALWAALGISTYLLQKGLKGVVARPRPALWHGPVALASFAFPSGHALAAATFYPLAARAASLRWPAVRRAAWAWAALMALYVGFGRLYLGVHWPSDVLAGWAIGVAQTFAGVWLVTRHDAQVIGADAAEHATGSEPEQP